MNDYIDTKNKCHLPHSSSFEKDTFKFHLKCRRIYSVDNNSDQINVTICESSYGNKHVWKVFSKKSLKYQRCNQIP